MKPNSSPSGKHVSVLFHSTINSITQLGFYPGVRFRENIVEKWPELIRKSIENIGFTIDANLLPAKLRYRRRLWGGGGQQGWCDPDSEVD
jgi:hypothetical protein